ncbi:MAG: hypothetical protein QOG43_1044 [Actinomycetota bacterium]|jgi:hypothetical protein|nr:hypothetical protein [Actinomycetota bacterium]
MAIAMLVDNPAVSQEVYDKVRAQLGVDAPPGGIVHLAGPAPGGGWRVVELWESREEAFRFFTECLAPALRALGVTGPPPEPQFWPVHNLITS